jgi:hypothetical protein
MFGIWRGKSSKARAGRLPTAGPMQTPSFTRDFIFRAVRPDELALVLGVRRAVYIDELGYDAASILADPIDERACHFVATTRGGDPVAAMRIIDSDRRPFEVERFVDIAGLLIPDGRPGEISRMCILPAFRSLTRSQFVHAGMWKLAYDHAVACGLTDFWIWSPPEIAKVYEYLGFRKVPGLVFEHPLFHNRPYQVMHVDLRSLEHEYRARRHSLTGFLFGQPLDAAATVGPRPEGRSHSGR